jgi:hypothetical protein
MKESTKPIISQGNPSFILSTVTGRLHKLDKGANTFIVSADTSMAGIEKLEKYNNSNTVMAFGDGQGFVSQVANVCSTPISSADAILIGEIIGNYTVEEAASFYDENKIYQFTGMSYTDYKKQNEDRAWGKLGLFLKLYPRFKENVKYVFNKFKK